MSYLFVLFMLSFIKKRFDIKQGD